MSNSIVSLLVLACLMACSAYRDVTPSPVLPLQAAVNAAVVVEDVYEDRACDQQQTSFLESLSDVLATPWNTLWVIVAFELSIPSVFVDAAHGEPPHPERRFRELIRWLPVHYAGVPPWEEQHRQPGAACP